MKKTLTLLAFVCLGLSGIDQSEASQVKKIRMLFADQEAIVVLDDHPAARDLMAMLPLTITFEDYNGIEKIGYPPRKLHLQDSPTNCDPSEGTFAYYAPWGNLSVFYRDFGYSRGLAPLGRVESGLDGLSRMRGDFDVRLEPFE